MSPSRIIDLEDVHCEITDHIQDTVNLVRDNATLRDLPIVRLIKACRQEEVTK